MSALKRFFVDKIRETATLSGEEFEHAKNVLRLGVGDEVILLDNSGKEYTCIVSTVEKKSMLLNVLGVCEGDKEAKTPVALVFGYLKNADKNEFIVQKAVELGVKEIIAFSSEYSSAYMNENKLERLNKVSKESAKQCLRSYAPSVRYAKTLKEALECVSEYENKLFACEFATQSKADLTALCGSTAIVVGSEGGFSKGAEKMASELGFASVTLGKRILRAETACIAVTSIVSFSLGELGELPSKCEGQV